MQGSEQDRLAMLSSLFPLLYGAVFIALLWQAFRVMSKGFKAASAPLSSDRANGAGDRTGQVTELLDQDGRITEEDLLTVRFSTDEEPPSEEAGTRPE